MTNTERLTIKEQPDVLSMATERAEKKLERIIENYGDADGERRKPYYLEELIQEETTVIYWHILADAMMQLENIKNAPVPTKATEAAATH